MNSIRHSIRAALTLLREARSLPRVSINLMLSAAADAPPFYRNITREFYRQAVSRHWKMPLFRQHEFFALSDVSDGAEAYFGRIESSARRNVRKARRLGYRAERIRISEHAAAVPAILASSKVRQGPMPREKLEGYPKKQDDPPASNSDTHDYPYFGVFMGEQLVAYAACLVAGELCEIEVIYGHADFQSDGVVPLMLVAICEYVEKTYPAVRYYSYGGFFGAGTTMQRFKKKFDFRPHRISWCLDQAASD